MNPTNRHCQYTEEHYKYCTTDRQKQFLELVLSGMTIDNVAKAMGITARNAMGLGQRLRDNGLRYGYNAEAEAEGNMPTPGQDLPVKGVSTLYKEDPMTGEVRPSLSWVKTDKGSEQMIREAKEIVRAMCEDIPRADPEALPAAEPGQGCSKLMNCHVLTDYHLGMLAWGDECGENWDTKIAEDFLMKFMSAAIAQAPAARCGMLLQLGDFLHFDGVIPVTPGSGHVVDADSRFAKVVRVAIRCVRRIISMMLRKYPEVRVVMAEGNHDLSASIWLREMLSNFYEDEPRVHIDVDPTPYGVYQHGETMVAWHHGHKKRIKDLDKVIAGKYPKIFGATTRRYVHMGHFHHKEMSESQLMISEMHPTIAAHDAYSSAGGYISQRFADVITYHEQYGEVARQRFTPELVRG